MKTLNLASLRREHNISWQELGKRIGIPWRTIQAIALRCENKDISQIKQSEEEKLKKVAELWGIDYISLFKEVESVQETDELDELEKLDEIITKAETYIAKNKNIPKSFKEFLNVAKSTKFLFTGDINVLTTDFLSASVDEYNSLSEKMVDDFFKHCAEDIKPDRSEQIIKELAERLLGKIDYLKIETLFYFFTAMHKNNFKEAEIIAAEATHKIIKLTER